MAYFTEREGALPPQTNTEIPTKFAEAIANEMRGLADRFWLARAWPVHCPDQQGVVVATDIDNFWAAARGKLNLAVNQLHELPAEPNLLIVLNLIEFVYEHVAYPVLGQRHDYYGHRHLDFDGPKGKTRFRADINAFFQRYGLAYELREEGDIIRLAPDEIHAQLVDAIFETGDDTLNALLNAARKKYLSPSAADRREGLEKLWDGFERLKTISDGKDKKAQSTALIESAYTDDDTRTRFNTEFNELTAIGNKYNIRHFEKDKLPIPDDAFVDWLFPRCYSAIHAILDKTGRVRH